ncbi:LOW QUALITY PROTEIN: hypothetical protein ACHAWX_000783 [Stephanocyclus meneghinianus]
MLIKKQINAEIPITTVHGGSETVFKRIMEYYDRENPILVDLMAAPWPCIGTRGSKLMLTIKISRLQCNHWFRLLVQQQKLSH